ncbi:uncharacterized protein EKO05_0010408 [Ascochyta rabiei]|uniref:Uncharacterized protein n=1 Tax=Didymella rabiei TaxID=5454 RepID=A0A163MBW9_DIDRA|nr:uncharacterized protein EKO05_0010408 [Ascochyta rabiei]KZM28576.1 hypothetical protein ST47_g282 [Ascochyta rabiei]UPX20167.1 hypothetical protein EKO05_0010408 [Ascochyta rabiei]
MSEPIPESIPTSADPRSHRPTKRRALTPRAGHASEVEALFAKPDRDIHIPGTALSNHLSAPPEIVANVQGSSAGAGSGEFHVYKASRRREYERLRAMDDQVKQEEDEKDFLAKRSEQEKKDAEKTERNRAKRAKALARKQKAKQANKGAPAEGDAAAKKKIAPRAHEVKLDDDTGAEAHARDVNHTEEIGLVIEDDD